MDQRTLEYYRAHAGEVAERFSQAHSGLAHYFSLAFPPGSRVLDVGAGSGRDMSALLAMGIDAYGVEPCAELRQAALGRYPELAGRLASAALPDLGQPFGGGFDGVLCSAVLMHLPPEEVPKAMEALHDVLKPGGRLLLSVVKERPGLGEGHRDGHGRLYTPLGAEELESLAGGAGFTLVGRWEEKDVRPGYSWWELLLEAGA